MTQKIVRTRFAPSPTGMLHIGGARTALFGYLYAKHCGGQFLGRIEDTDKERSTQSAVDVILRDLNWLGIIPDDPWVFQSKNEARHAAVAYELLAKGHAYKCYCTPEELEALRAKQDDNAPGFRSLWRDRTDGPDGTPYVVRLRIPQGETVWEDAVQGPIRIANTQIEDLVLLRSDGSPIYNLAVVVDDHDMAITHVIRGDDHINNTPKQILIYQAMGWEAPLFGHIPLIHGDDGKKLSKRTGAVAVDDFRGQGFLPEAILNHLMRLGWSAGDEEIISMTRAVELFDLTHIHKGAAVFNTQKLHWLNAEYIKSTDNNALVNFLQPFFADMGITVSERGEKYLQQGLTSLKPRAKTLLELAQQAAFYVKNPPFPLDEKAAASFNAESKALLKDITTLLTGVSEWNNDALYSALNAFATERGLKFPQVAMPIRAALTGSSHSPSISEIMAVLGRDESMKRLRGVL